jgi:hypothetical protein
MRGCLRAAPQVKVYELARRASGHEAAGSEGRADRQVGGTHTRQTWPSRVPPQVTFRNPYHYKQDKELFIAAEGVYTGQVGGTGMGAWARMHWSDVNGGAWAVSGADVSGGGGLQGTHGFCTRMHARHAQIQGCMDAWLLFILLFTLAWRLQSRRVQLDQSGPGSYPE